MRLARELKVSGEKLTGNVQSANRGNRAAVAKILTEVKQHVAIGHERRIGFDDHEIAGPSLWRHVQHQSLRLPVRTDMFHPGVNDGASKFVLCTHALAPGNGRSQSRVLHDCSSCPIPPQRCIHHGVFLRLWQVES
jgi:hypothetical protein